MTPVSAAKAMAPTGSLPSAVQPLAVGAPSAAPPLSFGLLLAEATIGGQTGPTVPKLLALPMGARSSAPLPPGRPTTPNGSGAHEGSNPVERRLARSGESLDSLPRRYLGQSSDLAAWLSWAAAPPPTDGGGAREASTRSAVSLEDLLPNLVRRVAWSTDGKRGTARLEIGSGDLAGATLLVHADAGRVRVQLEVPAGADGPSWRERIVRRLAAREIPVDEVEVS
jgi:hypothetical protein